MNGSDKLRFGVIGVGRYATGYHLPLIVRSGDAELVAIHRRSPDRLAQTAEAFDVPHAFADYREMLDSVDLDVVVVSGPQGLHHEWCMAALERGHHVLVDKPWVLRTYDAEKEIALARRQGAVLSVAYNRHLNPANVYAREVIERGELGQHIYASALQLGFVSQEASPWQFDPALGGGPLYGRGAHMADLLPWTTGLQPTAVQCALMHDEGLRVDVGGTITMTMEDGSLAQMTSLTDQDHNRDEAMYYGSEGSLLVYRPHRGMRSLPREQLYVGTWRVQRWDKDGDPVEVQELPVGSTTIDHMIDVVLGRAEDRCAAEQGITAVRVLEAAYEAAARGGVVAI